MTKSVLRQKIRKQKPDSPVGQRLYIGKYFEKSVSLAGLARLDTQIEASLGEIHSTGPAQFVEALFDSGLNLIIKAQKLTILGIVSLDCELVSSLIDILTGDLASPREADFLMRSPTLVEAALCENFVNGILSEMDGILSEQQTDFIAPDFHIGGPISEPSAHLFPDIPHTSITLDIDIENGTRGGKITISIPTGIWDRSCDIGFVPPIKKPDPVWNTAMEHAVEHSKVNLHAILHRKKMTIGKIMTLKLGDMLELPVSAIDNLTLTSNLSGKSSSFMVARLGEYQQMRAARILKIGPTRLEPDQKKLAQMA